MTRINSNAQDIESSRVGVLFVVAFSLLGLVVSLVLTVFKFQADFGCDATILNSCRNLGVIFGVDVSTHFDCEKAFTSEWSQLFGIPLTVFASAFYLVVFLIALGVARGQDPLRPFGRQTLLAMALFDVGVTVVMFGISKFLLDTICLYCTVLYLISIMLLASSLLANLARPEHASVGQARVSVLVNLMWAVSGVAFLAFVQGFTYEFMHRNLEPDCRVAIAPLPETRVVIGSDDPDVIVAAFVDPMCSACARDFEVLRRLPRLTGVDIQVRFYQLPRERDACGFKDAVVLAPMTVSDRNQSCVASLAVECMESMRTSTGIETLARAFDMQDDGLAPVFSADKFVGVGSELWVEVDASDDENALFRCIDSDDSPAATRVRSHLRYAAANGLDNTPATFLIPVAEGKPQWSRADRFKGGHGRKIEAAIARIVAQIPEF